MATSSDGTQLDLFAGDHAVERRRAARAGRREPFRDLGDAFTGRRFAGWNRGPAAFAGRAAQWARDFGLLFRARRGTFISRCAPPGGGAAASFWSTPNAREVRRVCTFPSRTSSSGAAPVCGWIPSDSLRRGATKGDPTSNMNAHRT